MEGPRLEFSKVAVKKYLTTKFRFFPYRAWMAVFFGLVECRICFFPVMRQESTCLER